MSKKDTSKTSEPKFENIDYYHTISLNLNHYRRCMGYTQAMLAEKVDLTSSYLSQIESINTVRSFSPESIFFFILFTYCRDTFNSAAISLSSFPVRIP